MCRLGPWIAASLDSNRPSLDLPGYVRLLPPVIVGVAVIGLAKDPTYRFPLLTLLLPFFLRGAAIASGISKEGPPATAQAFTAIGFAAFVIGWLLTLGVVGFAVAIVGFSAEPSADLLKRIMLFAATGLVLAAWFLWPWYARLVLPNWPRQDVRIWTSSGNRWDRVFTGWRLQQLAASGAVRWRGFGATALVLICVMASSATGVYQGIHVLLAELGCLLLLPFLHLVIVRDAHALCRLWAARADAEVP